MDKMDTAPTLPLSLPARPHQVISRVDSDTRKWLRRQARESKVSVSEVIYRRLLLAKQVTERNAAAAAMAAADETPNCDERRGGDRRSA